MAIPTKHVRCDDGDARMVTLTGVQRTPSGELVAMAEQQWREASGKIGGE